MSQAAIKSALSAQFASLATATAPLDPDPATNADLIYGRMATAIHNGVIVGNTVGGALPSGNIGEITESLVTANAVTLVNNVAVNVTSVLLPAGNYLIAGMISFTGTPSSCPVVLGAISTTNAGAGTIADSRVQFPFGPNASCSDISFSIGFLRANPLTVTTYYLVAYSQFVGTLKAGGRLTAVRIA